MNNNDAAPILAVINACDAVILATCDGKHPDMRHVTNAMNIGTTELNLFFMTSRDTPKYGQIRNNPECALYYFDDKTRHAVRLYGKIEFVQDADVRRSHWRPEFSKFGYDGPKSPDFILMRFVPESYKYYMGNEIKTGKL